MLRLDDRAWKSFTIEELFTRIEPTKGKTTEQLVFGGDVPYIAASKNNNGCAGVYSSKEYPEWVSEGNCIVFVQLGDGAAGLAHYVPMDFIGMNGKTSCGYIDGMLDRYNGVFIAKALSANKAIFSHGHSWTGRRLLKSRCMLPATSAGTPDYSFMSAYMQEIYGMKRRQYYGYVEKRISELRAVSDDQTANWSALIKSHKWKPFQIDAVFNILPGKRLVAADSTPGNRPFIGALDNSNGVARFVSDENESLDKNVLGVNYNGNGMVIGFYHPYECIFSDDVKRFHLKNHDDNAFALLFLKTVILMQKQKFGYLYKFNADRMAHTSIILPVADTGEPDYDFMELFGRKMMLNKYNQYLTFLAKSDGGVSVS